MRSRAFRRHQTTRHMMRRIKEVRNQNRGSFAAFAAPFWLWTEPKAMARFKEQPKLCGWDCCGNQRHAFGQYNPTIQELRFLCEPAE